MCNNYWTCAAPFTMQKFSLVGSINQSINQSINPNSWPMPAFETSDPLPLHPVIIKVKEK